ncbi:MAG: type I polyketide synthase [Terrimicrobiaceae bacterium]
MSQKRVQLIGATDTTRAMEIDEPIAITGIGCRFPGGGRGPDAFWKLLCRGVDAITEIPGDRWKIPTFYDPRGGLPGKTNSRWGGFIEGIDQFDAAFFGISPREASTMDPQQRLLLETAWEAIEDAGFVVDAAAGTHTGTFVGISTFDYYRLQSSFRNKTTIETHSTTGSVLSIAANRISYLFNFHGPSLVVDTACSSSLVALHLACQSLRNGECTTALAGGVNVLIIPDTFIGFSRMSMLSPDGRCKAFDASGNGFVRAEGAGVIVLKPLSTAQADGDRIYCVIRGTAVNQDGKTSSLTVPGLESQQRLIRHACREAGVNPLEIDYVEAHGTGTSVGDPIEAAAIGAVIGEKRLTKECLLGSVKTNIGHLEAGSGIAGVIKTALALHHGEVPPNLHFENPNPDIDFKKWKLRVPVVAEKLTKENALAGVNSFGFGGTNAHAILQRFPSPAIKVTREKPALFCLSARNLEGLNAIATQYAGWLGASQEVLSDICHNLSSRRIHHPHRLAIAADSKVEVIEKLEAFLANETRPGLASGVAGPLKPLAFVFTGQGPQWWAMGRELLSSHKTFQEKIAECDALFRQWGDWSLIEELSREESASRMDLPSIAQPSIFALQVALCAWWEEHGICPDAVIGHSVGEAVAAYFAGSLDLPSAAKVIFERGRCMQLVPPTGKMLAVALSPEAITPWLAGFKRHVEIGAINSPRSVTVSGEPSALEQIAARLTAANIWCRFLRVNYAFHSAQMDPVKKALKAALREISSKPPTLPFCSTVTGKISTHEKYEAEYWWKNVRQPVRFAEGIQTLIQAGFTDFLEVGPHPALSGMVSECLKAGGVEGTVAHSLRRGDGEETTLISSLGALHVKGTPVRWGTKGCSVRLPLIPWKHERFWHETPESAFSRMAPPAHPLLGCSLGTAEPVWELPVHFEVLPYLRDHGLNSHVVFPAAGYLEMAIAAGHNLQQTLSLAIEDVEFQRALFLTESDGSTSIEFRSDSTGAFFVHARGGANRPWASHCVGKIRKSDAAVPERLSLAAIQARCAERKTGESCYEVFREKGFHYGGAFCGISQVWRRDGEALGEISMPEDLVTEGYHIHPALMDSCLQVVLSALSETGMTHGLFLPVKIDRLLVFAPASRKIWSYVELIHQSEKSITADVRLMDENGGAIAIIEGFTCTALEQPSSKQHKLDACLYGIEWTEKALEVGALSQNAWVFIGGNEPLIQSTVTAMKAGGDFCEVVPSVGGLESTLASCPHPGHVVVFATTSGEGANPAEELCVSLLETVQKFVARGSGFRLIVVTRGAQPVLGTAVSPAQGALLGLIRVVMNEHQELGCRTIDLGSLSEEIEALAAELRFGDEEEVALRGGQRHVPRLARVSPQPKRLSGTSTPFRLETVKPGVFDQIAFRKVARSSPKAGEVEVEVLAAGLNFRDVMKVLGIYPLEEAVDSLLGDEFAGRITSVGAGVTDLQPGDEVLGISPGCFAKFLILPSEFVARKPQHLTFEEAATIPVTFLTAQYALHHLARIQPGEKVLIHAAAGGVGLAALQIAKLAGAEIFATASKDKQDLVRRFGAAHVMDSRSLEFAREIMEITEGAGVDIVLNSLAGEAISQSLSVLAPYGRFLEIGKRDIYQNSKIGLRPFRQNLSFFAIDLSRLLRDRPQLLADIFGRLLQEFVTGRLKPLPTTIYPITHAPEAFREMASGKHIGKIVFSLGDSAAIPVLPRPGEPIRFRKDGTYLITGGVGGFGLAVAEWMISQGAQNLVLVGSRQSSVEAARKHFEGAAAKGLNILAWAVDVNNEVAMDNMFREIQASLPPLRGVIHAAMKIDDAVLQHLNAQRFRTVMGPKAAGAWNLHVRSKDLPLDFFVMFSSIASVIGNHGQGNYAAANAFLDALAAHRHSLGLPALTINWGHLGGIGYVSRNSHVSEYLNRHGIPELTPSEVVELLGRLIQAETTQVSAMRIDWPRWLEANPRLSKLPRYREILAREVDSSQGPTNAGGSASAILKASGEERLVLLELFVRETAARVLGLPAAKLDPARPLMESGLDSLMAIELVNRLEEGLQLRFPVEKIAGGPSITKLAQILADSMPKHTGS